MQNLITQRELTAYGKIVDRVVRKLSGKMITAIAGGIVVNNGWPITLSLLLCPYLSNTDT